MNLPDRLQRTVEYRGDQVHYRFANGLEIRTEVFNKEDRLRILPLGTPQGSLMNHMLSFPESVRGKSVFEPFAGSGALGFMALAAGAAHVDFLDINPRAAEFHGANAGLNRFNGQQYRSITGDIAVYTPPQRYDLLVANPPFVPTPDGIEGTITSNGGAEGSRFVEILLRRLDELLLPSGRALVYVFQFAKGGVPLVVDLIAAAIRDRPVEITPAQAKATPLQMFADAYARLFTNSGAAIDRWRTDLLQRHGADLTLCHYIVDIGPQSAAAASCVLRDNFAEKFGDAFLVPTENEELLALDRAFENFVPGRG
jgi:hypothetical protein